MIYVLDSNIFIESRKKGFGIEETPEFWSWLLKLCAIGRITIPQEVFKEVAAGNDDLAEWFRMHEESLNITSNAASIMHMGSVMNAYSDGVAMHASSLEMLRADPFVVASACLRMGVVVSDEQYEPHENKSTRRKPRKIPNVCRDLGLTCVTLAKFLWVHRKDKNL